jgi:hypothetical protein
VTAGSPVSPDDDNVTERIQNQGRSTVLDYVDQVAARHCTGSAIEFDALVSTLMHATASALGWR